MDAAVFADCWWCGTRGLATELVHLEGARLAGSPPLALPGRLSAAERLSVVVDVPCAIALATARARHDAELAEAHILPGGTTGPAPTVEARLRRAISDQQGDQR